MPGRQFMQRIFKELIISSGMADSRRARAGTTPLEMSPKELPEQQSMKVSLNEATDTCDTIYGFE